MSEETVRDDQLKSFISNNDFLYKPETMTLPKDTTLPFMPYIAHQATIISIEVLINEFRGELSLIKRKLDAIHDLLENTPHK